MLDKASFFVGLLKCCSHLASHQRFLPTVQESLLVFLFKRFGNQGSVDKHFLRYIGDTFLAVTTYSLFKWTIWEAPYWSCLNTEINKMKLRSLLASSLFSPSHWWRAPFQPGDERSSQAQSSSLGNLLKRAAAECPDSSHWARGRLSNLAWCWLKFVTCLCFLSAPHFGPYLLTQSCPAGKWLNSRRSSTTNLSVLHELHLHSRMQCEEGSLPFPKFLGVG